MPATNFPLQPVRWLMAQTENWLARSSLVLGIKTMLGYDLSWDHAENVAANALD